MMEIEFRTTNPNDFEIITHIWVEAKLPYKPKGRDNKENLIKQMKIKNNRFILAEIEGKAVGIIIASHNGRKGWLNRLAVLPEYRNKGIATALIEKGEEFLYSEGIRIYTSLIEADNSASLALFNKNKYVKHDDIIYFSKRLSNEV